MTPTPVPDDTPDTHTSPHTGHHGNPHRPPPTHTARAAPVTIPAKDTTPRNPRAAVVTTPPEGQKSWTPPRATPGMVGKKRKGASPKKT